MPYRIYFIILLIFFSCKKEVDNQKPIIEINSPKENSIFSVLGNIEVNASIHDDGIIQSISISIYDFNSKRNLLKPRYFYPNSSSFQLDANYIISDSLIFSGDYYLTITATDNENQSTAYRAIKIKGIDKKKISTIIATSDDASTSIYAIDSGNSPQIITSFDKECRKIIIDNYNQTLWFLPQIGNKLIAYDLIDNRIDFEYNHLATSNANVFTDMSLNHEILYVAAKSGHIKGFNASFNQGFIYQSTTGRFVKRIFESPDLLIVSESNFANQNELLTSIYKVSGSPKSSLEFNKELIGFQEKNTTDGYLIFAKDSTFYFYGYDLELGSSNQLYNFQAGEFYDAIPIGNQEFLLVGNKKVVRFNIATKFMMDMMTNLENGKAVYDEVNQLVYISNNKTLSLVDIQTGVTLNSMLFQENISAIAIRYNR